MVCAYGFTFRGREATVNKNNGWLQSNTYQEETLWEGGPTLARDMRGGPYKEVALRAEIRTRWEPGLGEEERQE